MTLLLVTSCSNRSITSPESPVVIDSACTLFSPIYTHGNDAERMDVRTVRAINNHNDLWDQHCGQPAQ
ncbi:hypothetical protein FCN45_04290 [Pantoea sp. SO10]|jgi:hypothetical protein|nr:hypothetical protein FCN45_04290 [Pantoea sp. SO10]